MRRILSLAVLAVSPVSAADDVCNNIRLSASEMLDCRGRIANALGDADRGRIQNEFEDRVRRNNDKLITPPVLANPLAPSSPPLPPPPRLSRPLLVQPAPETPPTDRVPLSAPAPAGSQPAPSSTDPGSPTP